MRPNALVLFCASVIPFALPAKSYAESAPAQTEQITADALKHRGEQLHAEIDATYKQLRASNSLRNSLQGGNDVTAIALKYIPIGIGFADAEAILRAAGCTIVRSKQGHVSARSNLTGGFFDLYGHAFTVDLVPHAAGDFSVVAEVRANIFAKYVPNADKR
jgi:hypothetical protein